MDAESVRKTEFFNLAATNAILMKLTTIMYLQKTFHVAKKKKKKKKMGRNSQGVKGCKQKIS